MSMSMHGRSFRTLLWSAWMGGLGSKRNLGWRGTWIFLATSLLCMLNCAEVEDYVFGALWEACCIDSIDGYMLVDVLQSHYG